MEAHNRFLNLSTTGVTLLLDSLAANREAAFRDLATKYNIKIRNGDADLKTLEAFRMILCYEYQSLIESRSGEADAKSPKADRSFLKSAENSDVDIKSYFIRKDGSWNKQELALLYDILVLQLVLHSEPKTFAKLFNHFHAAQQASLPMSIETQNLCMRVSECFADTYNLQYNLYKQLGEETELQEQYTRIQAVIKSWIKQQEDAEWRLLASLLPKLVITFGSEKIVTPLWEEILDKPGDLGNTLTALCVMADVCFPCEAETAKETHYYKQCTQDCFWLQLLQGLESAISQHRKQALYLVKRAVDFMERHESAVKNELKHSTASIVPFVCRELQITDPSIRKTKISLFMILEVLEEKQKHLVLPTLSYFQSLVEAYAFHRQCQNCFDVVWMRCVLRRIMQHDNEAVKIFGLKATLEGDLYIVDETFLNFLANVLNNTFLYAHSIDYQDKVPEIAKLLLQFLQRSNERGVDIINRLIRAISRVSWGSVALYWVLWAADQVQVTHDFDNTWTSDEEKSVLAVIANNIMRLGPQLRMSAQIMILRIFREHIWDPSKLELIVYMLSLFPESVEEEPLHRLKYDGKQRISFPSDARSWVIRTCDNFFATNPCVKSLAQLISVVQDLGLISRTQPCPAEKALRQLFQILIDADLRPYADPVLILKVLDFMSHLINVSCKYKWRSLEAMKILISPYGDAIMKLVNRSLERKTIAKYDEYLLAVEALINSMNCRNERDLHVPWWPDTERQLERFEDKCIHIITNPNDFDKTQWSYAIKVLRLCREETFSRRPNLAKTYIPPLLSYFNSLTLVNNDGDPARQTGLPRGKFASDCFETIANLVRQVIIKLPVDSWPPDVNWLQVLRNLVDTESEEVIDPVASALYELFEKNVSLAIQDTDTVIFIVKESARCIFQLKRTQVFFSAIKQLTRLIVNSTFLKLDGAVECAIEYVNRLMTEAERVPTLKRIFLISVGSLCPQDLLYFRKPFISCLLHGKVLRRDQSIEVRTLDHSLSFFRNGKRFSYADVNIDKTVRAESVIVLLGVLHSTEDSEILGKLLMDLLEILERNKNKRYFDNSHLHMLKQRVMQTLLIMESFLNEVETRTLHDAMCELLIAESDQPSVRWMHEWIVTRIHLKNSTMRESIWSLFDTAVKKRPGSVVSLASIVYHVSRLLENETRTNYVEKAVKPLLSNGMNQQYNVRLYSQVILVEILLLLDPPEATKYALISEAVKSLYRGKILVNSLIIKRDIYFAKFHPILNYNLEMIYCDLPRLKNVSDDELIEVALFEDLDVSRIKNVRDIGNPTDLRFEAKPILESLEATGKLAEGTDQSADEGPSDVQKKIIPWKSMVPFYDELSETSKATLSRRKMQNEDAGIIVVASLVDRPPNLGGLARTCEIFGARELVIGSLRYVEDHEFQTLSVSAEKWIAITAVKPHLLKSYLLEKQSEGWKLVGAEQTANSTNILEMKFDKKTILLLGNEKDGIPANLIPILDTCVEIPQNGVVRSLNVHVTGAICIWQYVTQHIFT